MVKVRVNAYGSVNREAGWAYYKEFDFEQEKVTVEDMLKSIKLKNGRFLFDLVANDNGIKANLYHHAEWGTFAGQQRFKNTDKKPRHRYRFRHLSHGIRRMMFAKIRLK